MTTDAWFSPRSLTLYEVRPRPLTRWIFIELRDEAGLAGVAELTPVRDHDSAIATAARLAGRLRGEKIRSDSHLLAILDIPERQIARDLALATGISGVRTAVADALARRTVLPLHEFLRLPENPRSASPLATVPAASLTVPGSAAGRTAVPLYANINRAMLPKFPEKVGMAPEPSDRSPDGFAGAAARAREAGFTAFKCAPFDECRAPFKTPGLPPEARLGLERVQAAKDAVGRHRLFVDCHSRFDLGSALALEPELRAAGAAWFEEPVEPDAAHLDDLRKIHDASQLPLAGGEMCYGLDAFARLISSGALDIVMPDIKYCGGAVEAWRIGLELERESRGSVSMHCPSGPVSLLASAHVTHAVGADLPLEHAVFEVEWRREMLWPRESIEKGALLIPEGPGLGAELDVSVVLARGRRWEP